MKNITKLSLLFMLFTSCEKLLVDENPANTPQSNFDILWNTVDQKYSFFELKNINWDSVKAHYQPQVQPGNTDKELFDVLDSMLFDLRDGHVNLISDFNVSRNWQWYLDYPVNFNYNTIERNYLGNNYRIAGGLKYTIIDSIGYVYYGSFSSGISLQHLKEVTDYFKNTEGVIIDVRDNSGGSLYHAYSLSSAFANEEKTVLITQEKTGPGRNDFGKTSKVSISPLEGANYQGPVVVLLNRKSYSATNTFAAIMSNFSHVTLIGDKSGGGGGLPVDYELPNGWRFRFSATVSYTPDGKNIELGVPVDISVNNDPQINALGTDQILEYALDYLD